MSFSSRRIKQILRVALTVLVFVLPATAFGREGWLSTVDEGMAAAKAQGKDVLVDFGGSDWCHWCQQLNKEVYAQDTFQQAKERFVLVSLDFPQDRTGMSIDQQKHNEEWQAKFEVGGFPMVFLLDAAGRPYARTGYREGGAGKYVEHLSELQEIRTKRDAALTLARATQGLERAKHLDAAIQTMEPGIVWLGYGKVVDQIALLDADDTAGLRSKWLVGRELQPILKQFNPEDTMATVTKLKALRDKLGLTGKVRGELNGMMGQMLVQGGEFEEAITLADETLADKDLDEEAALNWKAVKIQALARKKDFDGALKELDVLMAGGKINGQVAVALHGLKAQVLVGAGREADAVAVLDGFLPQVPDGQLKQQLRGLRDGIQQRLDGN